jgi:hypothetical protein
MLYMKRWTTALWALGLAASPLWAADQACQLVKIEKHVDVQLKGGAWTAATVPMELGAGDQIHTGFKATATLKFPDGTLVTVKPMTMMRVQRVEQNGNTVSSKLLLRMGEVKASVGDSATLGSDFQVQTATCTASVRGTEIDSIGYNPAVGTTVAMGNEGALQVSTAVGNVMIGAESQTHAASENEAPATPEELASGAESTSGAAQLTSAESETLENVGVPKSQLLNEGGANASTSALESTGQSLSDANTINSVNETVSGVDLNGDGIVSVIAPGTRISSPPGSNLPQIPGVVVPDCCP